MNELYELKYEEFQGPVGKLLELIEARQMEITRVNLADVTADFLAYLKNLGKVDSKILADFISVAAKLILIKSHALLPSLEIQIEEEKEIADLEKRLKIYREFKAAGNGIKNLWGKKMAFSKGFFINVPEGFYLTENIMPSDLERAIRKLGEELALISPEREEKGIKLINFEEKITELMRRVNDAMQMNFSEVAKDRNRAEIVALFLALLHLLKDNLIRISQEDKFSEIKISSIKQNE